jgi:hypothetical protein
MAVRVRPPKIRGAAATPLDLIDFRQTGASTSRIRLAGCGSAHGQILCARTGALPQVRLFGGAAGKTFDRHTIPPLNPDSANCPSIQGKITNKLR